MPDQSLSTPSTSTFPSFQELTNKLYSVATVVDDCKWVANALHLSASSSAISTSHEAYEASKRMQGVSRILFTILQEAGNDMLNLAEAFEKRGEVKS